MPSVQIVAVVIPFFRIGFCASSLIFMLAYVWSKNFATQDVSLYGLLTIQVRNDLNPRPWNLDLAAWKSSGICTDV